MCFFSEADRTNAANCGLPKYLRVMVSPVWVATERRKLFSYLCFQVTPRYAMVLIQIIDLIQLKASPIGTGNDFKENSLWCLWLLGGTVLKWNWGEKEGSRKGGRNMDRSGVVQGFQISFWRQATAPSDLSFCTPLFQHSTMFLTHQGKAQDDCCLYSLVMLSPSFHLIKD